MALSHYSHTRLVFWLKVTLPIVALMILSSLFLFARHIDFENALPYADVDVNALARDPHLSAPEFTGTTTDGAAVRVAASVVRPDPADKGRASAEKVTALYEAKNGNRLALEAQAARFDNAAALLTLTGGVHAATKDGYQFTSEAMQASLSETKVTSDVAVTVKAPFGTINAGAMQLTAPGGQYQLVFKQGVRLLYSPTN